MSLKETCEHNITNNNIAYNIQHVCTSYTRITQYSIQYTTYNIYNIQYIQYKTYIHTYTHIYIYICIYHNLKKKGEYKLEGEFKGDMVKMIALMFELDLLNNWIPFIGTSAPVKNGDVTLLEKYVHLITELPYLVPFSNRYFIIFLIF